MLRLFILTFCMLACTSAITQAQTDQRPAPFRDIQKDIDEGMPPFLGTNRDYSEIMFDRQNHVTDKAAQQLLMRKDGTLLDNKFIVGGRFIGTIMHERTNTDGKFPILSRLPPTHTSGNSDTFSVVNDASVNFTLPLPYFTAFAQGEYTEVEYTGQSPRQWRKYWVTLGDLETFPAYLTFGKKTVSFGDFSSYAPFTHNHSSHYFWAQNNDDPLFELGYVNDNTHLTASLIKSDRGNRVINAPADEHGYQNFAFSGSHKFTVGDIHRFKIGAGYLRGTIYDSTLAHHPPGQGLDDRTWADAWNINAKYSVGKFDIMAEFTRTFDEWPATDHEVHALSLQARYLDHIGKFPTIYSLMYSDGIQGDNGDEWHAMRQGVLGIETRIHPNISIGAEYLINDGFVPLIMPTFTADDGVVSHTFIMGTKITF